MIAKKVQTTTECKQGYVRIYGRTRKKKTLRKKKRNISASRNINIVWDKHRFSSKMVKSWTDLKKILVLAGIETTTLVACQVSVLTTGLYYAPATYRFI